MGVCMSKDRGSNNSSGILEPNGRFRSQWGVAGDDMMVQEELRNGHLPNTRSANPIQFYEPPVAVLFVLGGPGSGKITHCDHMVHDKQGMVHINMTDLMQQHVVGNELTDFNQIPAGQVSEVLMMEMKMSPASSGFVISGYPRNMRDTVEYAERMRRLDGVILLDWHEKILEKQIEFGVSLGAIVLDLAKMELRNYKKNVRPVAEYYDHKGMLYVINGERHPEEVYGDFFAIVDKILVSGNLHHKQDTNSQPIKNTDTVMAQQHQQQPPPPQTKTMPLMSSMPSQKMDRKAGIDNPPVLWVMGGPGSNKSSLSRKVAALHPGWVHFSIGEMLRQMAEQADKSSNQRASPFHAEHLQKIKNFIMQGELVPQDIVLKILGSHLMNRSRPEGFIIDGFPRDFNQMQMFESHLQQEPPLILIDCSELELGRNLGQRQSTEKRVDDEIPAAVRRRLQLYRDVTLPMLKALDQKSRLIIVDGDVDGSQVLGEFKRAVGTVIGLLRTTRNPFGGTLVQNGMISQQNKVPNGRAVQTTDYGPRMPVMPNGNVMPHHDDRRNTTASVDTITAMYNEVEEFNSSQPNHVGHQGT